MIEAIRDATTIYGWRDYDQQQPYLLLPGVSAGCKELGRSRFRLKRDGKQGHVYLILDTTVARVALPLHLLSIFPLRPLVPKYAEWSRHIFCFKAVD